MKALSIKVKTSNDTTLVLSFDSTVRQNLIVRVDLAQRTNEVNHYSFTEKSDNSIAIVSDEEATHIKKIIESFIEYVIAS